MNIEYTNTVYHIVTNVFIVLFYVLKDMKCFQNDIIKYNPHFYIKSSVENDIIKHKPTSNQVLKKNAFEFS
jgi:hypothetical protein